MGSKSSVFQNELLKHIFQNVAIANIGSAAGLPASSSVGNLYVRLYTTTLSSISLGTECAYTGYVQYGIAVPRNSTNWLINTNKVSNNVALAFGLCTAGTETIKAFAIWKTNTNNTSTERLYWGQLATEFIVSPGITPTFDVGMVFVLEE